MSLLAAILAAVLSSPSSYSQEATAGLSVPLTVSGSAQYTRASETTEPIYHRAQAGMRAVVSPSLQFNPHWFAYAATDIRSNSYGQYTSASDNGMSATLMQAFLGYKTEWKTASLLIKAGRLTSTFGLYPLEYDDAKTPLIGLPIGYAVNLPLRPDQLPCNLHDIWGQSADDPLTFHCGGATGAQYGMLSVALYGIPGVEAQLSWKRVDARLQITNSSPANPLSLLSRSQRLQWTAGGGYSFPGGFHVGASGFRGPYLDEVVTPYLPPGQHLNTFPASGIGLDVVWLHGPWSAQGEWQRFEFALPGFSRSPSSQTAYAQLKRVLSPRVFVAVRTSIQAPGMADRPTSPAPARVGYADANQEIVVGYRLNRFELLKLGFNYAQRPSWSLENGWWNAEHGVGVQVQLVTSLTAISKAFR